MEKDATAGDTVPVDLLADWLQNKPSFSAAWLDDPTISGMLEMLESIHRKFRDSAGAGFLDKLTKVNVEDCPVFFYFKNVDPMADDGELFIKMNSRGKLLTEYEYFKADFQRLLKKAGIPAESPNSPEKVARRMDCKWEPSFWRLLRRHGCNDATVSPDLDDCMMRYINYVTDVLCFTFRMDDAPLFTKPCDDGLKYHRKRLERLLFDGRDRLSESRLNSLLSFLDVWTSDGEDDPGYSFFAETFRPAKEQSPAPAQESGRGKITIFATDAPIQLLLAILLGKTPLTQEHSVLFFAATVARIHHVAEEDAKQRLRSARNLFHKMDRGIGEMPYVYRRVRILMRRGKLVMPEKSDVGSKTFTAEQVREERFKLTIFVKNPEFAADIRAFEESPWFKGSIAALLPPDYDNESCQKGLQALFYRRREAFEISFGDLQGVFPDALIRSVLFWANRGPYCISAGNSAWYWGSSSDKFSWQENTRPFLSRLELSEVFRHVLDEVSPLIASQPNLRGKELLEELANRLRKSSPSPEASGGCDAAYYMTKYYGAFFETFDCTYPNNIGLMKSVDSDTSFRAVNFYAGKRKSKAYWDPYLYVIWRKSGIDPDIDGIINPGGTTGSSARFVTQDVFVDSRATRFIVSALQNQIDELKNEFPSLETEENPAHDGLCSWSLPIPQHPTKSKADAEDRIQIGLKLFKAISALPAPSEAQRP